MVCCQGCFGLKGHRFLAKFPQGKLVGKQQRNTRPDRADFEKLSSYPRRGKLCSCRWNFHVCDALNGFVVSSRVDEEMGPLVTVES